MTVLSQCGLADSTVRSYLARGLTILPEMCPVDNPMRSSAPDWWVYAVDDFTPPLTKSETARYIARPAELGHDLMANLDLFSELCEQLLLSMDQAPKLAPGHLQAAAYLSVLRIFQSAMDYHYYRFDRHFDYHDYLGSPVGYHWSRLARLTGTAAKRLGWNESEFTSHEIALGYLTTFGKELPASTVYLETAQRFADDFLSRWGDTLLGMSAVDIRERLGTDRSAIAELSKVAARFRQTEEELLDNILKVALLDHPPIRTLRHAEAGHEQRRRVEQVLSPEERQQLIESVKAMLAFQLAQEEEPFRFFGLTAHGHGRILDVGFRAWQALATLTTAQDASVVDPQHQHQVEEIFGGNPVFGTRKLLHVGEGYFDRKVINSLREELDRWTKEPVL